MKLAFIVQRYGREILGGSETLARQLAERLSRRHEITVLTTVAKDYITWKSEYEAGEEKQRGVRLVRFPVEGERDIDEFNKFSEEIYKGETSREQELEWLDRQGPVCPELVEYLKKEHHQFDLLVFFTYLYYPTFHGLQVAPEKSVLVPTAHDEPPLKLGIFKEMFQLPGSFLFNTEAEEQLVLERFPVHKKMRETIGMGMELLDTPDPAIFRKRHDASAKYFLYAGRIDGGKGLEELFRYFTFYKEENPASGNLELMLIGKLGMKLPDDKSIRYAGFVDEAEKLSAMAGAIAVLQPSKMESLSIVTLEAFAVGTPVVANAASRVLIDHCRKANAGFYYRDFEEFEGIISLLLSDVNLGRSLGKNGQRYIKEHYGWQKLLTKYEHALRASGRPSKETKDSRRRDRAETTDETKQPARRPARAPKSDSAAAQSGERGPGHDRGGERESEPVETAEATRSSERPEPEKPTQETAEQEATPLAGAVSESADPDATLGEDELTPAEPQQGAGSAETSSPPDGRSDAGVDESVDSARSASDVAPIREPLPAAPASSALATGNNAPTDSAANAEVAPDEPRQDAEPARAVEGDSDVAVSEDVAHLPSFFQAAVPARERPTMVPIAPKPKAAAPDPKPEPPPPPPAPAPPADGGLPAFFRPKPTALSKAAPRVETEDVAEEPTAATRDDGDPEQPQGPGLDASGGVTTPPTSSDDAVE